MSADRIRIRLEPLSVELDVPRGSSLVAALATHGFEFPCGGMGECGGCGARVLSGTLPMTERDRESFTPDKLWPAVLPARRNRTVRRGNGRRSCRRIH